MQLVNRFLLLLSLTILLLSCDDKREDLKRLEIVNNNINKAIKSQDRAFVETVIIDIELMEEVFPELQTIKEKKYTLEIRLGRYEDAIKTIDQLILLSPENIDDRIVQGILYEIIGHKSSSDKVWEEALFYIEDKIENIDERDPKRKLGRLVNRVMILKLLGRDSQEEYDSVKSNPIIGEHSEILQLLYLLENGSRDQLIARYRS